MEYVKKGGEKECLKLKRLLQMKKKKTARIYSLALLKQETVDQPQEAIVVLAAPKDFLFGAELVF